MSRQLSLAYSTCPNDTYLFHAIAHKRIALNELSYSIELDDVETLNQKASNGIYDISKLSFAAIGQLQKSYSLLKTGAALGRGCGPLLIANPGYKSAELDDSTIAVPGLMTTANMLLGMWMNNRCATAPMTFDRIMPAVRSGEFQFGVIIHEGRFTYQDYGLECVVDLGQWWEEKTGLPIPLGGIAVKRTLSSDIAKLVEASIGSSVQYAFDNPSESSAYVKSHAQELSDDVIRQHISLYVNDFTRSLGSEGETAVETFFEMARSKGIMPGSDLPLFAT